MTKITISALLVDGSSMPYINEMNSCKEIVQFICGDDLSPPAQQVRISIATESGKLVEISIPNGHNTSARVTIDGIVV